MSNEEKIEEIGAVLERRSEDGDVEPRVDEDLVDYEWREETLVEHIGRAARQNPVSAALVGAGLVWMALGGARNVVRRVDAAGAVVGDAARVAGSAARQTARAVGDAVTTTAESAQEAALSAGKNVARTTRKVVRSADETATQAADVASRKASRAEDYVEGTAKRAGSVLSAAGEEIAYELRDTVVAVQRAGERAVKAAGNLAQDRPILFSALCLGVGAGAAALLPRTRTEDELFGEYSGEATRAARQRTASLVSGGVRSARTRTSEAVHEVAHKAAEQAADQVLRQAGGIGEAVMDTFDKVIRDGGTGKNGRPDKGAESKRDESKGTA